MVDEVDFILVPRNPSCCNEEDSSYEHKRTLIIITGGTICMRPNKEEGISMSSLQCASLEDEMRALPEMKDASLPQFDVIEWEELTDSSDMNSARWRKIVEQIHANYEAYNGFVVLIGTDTLAYTSSALSFMLRNLRKPVVLTGAMLPISHINTDARRNLCSAMLVAGFSNLQEVVVCFGGNILRGCRATKISCCRFDAYESPECFPLGSIGIDLIIRKEGLLSPPEAMEHLSLQPQLEICPESIFVFDVTPGFNSAIIRTVASVDKRPLGIILRLFGTGTGPMGDSSFMRGIKFAIASGVTIVAVTQCVWGTCSLRTYANGEMLYNIGVIEGKDMTTEAAFAKLAYLFAQGIEGSELRTLMMKNLRGEFSSTPRKITGQSALHFHRYLSGSSVEDALKTSPTKSVAELADSP